MERNTGMLGYRDGDLRNGRLLALGENPDSFFETIPGLFLILDPELRIIDATDAYLSATMTERVDIVGRGMFEVFPDDPEDPRVDGEQNLRASLERLKSSLKPDTMEVHRYDVRRPSSSGGGFETRYWSSTNTPVVTADGVLSHIVHQVEDVTEFVQLQVECEGPLDDDHLSRSKIDTVHAEILERSAELQRANDRLRAASDAKNMFLSRMSHELRSPLTAVIGYSELLMVDAPSGGAELESAEAIFRAGAHLLDLINEVLDITQVESGLMTMSLEPAPLENALQSAVELTRPFASTHGISLVLRPGPTALYVKADPQRLAQVIVNLISNAIKYNRPGGRVEIQVSEPAEKRVRIAISDTGRGINAEGLAKLFQPFERLDAAATGVEGTGLGLSLSRSLVEQMSGTIDVESEVGVGSTFSIELDKVQPALLQDVEEAKSPAFEVVVYPEEKKLLYIEDSAANLRLVERVLDRRPQVTVLSSTRGLPGVALAHQHHPDLILLDLHLPDVNGSEVIARLKADPDTRDIPVVILSADAGSRQHLEALALEASSYLTKPIRMADLLQTVDTRMKDLGRMERLVNCPEQLGSGEGLLQ